VASRGQTKWRWHVELIERSASSEPAVAVRTMKVLAIGAHPDDVELGCGGVLALHRLAGDEVHILVMTEGQRGPQQFQSRVDEQVEAASTLGAGLHWGGFFDTMVPEGAEAVSAVEAVLEAVGADVVYTHSPEDSHQDHRRTAEAVLAAARRVPRVLHWESPTTLRFAPTIFVDISEVLDSKLEAIRAHFSQVIHSGMVDLEVVVSLARLRGFQSRSGSFAEAFEAGRFLWEPVQVPGRGAAGVEGSSTRPLDLAGLACQPGFPPGVGHVTLTGARQEAGLGEGMEER
jgi:LmbE family N-acetylglucosaminyl deacetylase